MGGEMNLTEALKRALENYKEPPIGRLDMKEYSWLVSGAHKEHARTRGLVMAMVEIVERLSAEYPCEAHDMEPNTTMDYLRCDRCGIRPPMADALDRLAKEVEGCK